MPLVKTAHEISSEIQPMHHRDLQHDLLHLIRERPYWVVDRAFWRTVHHRLNLDPWRAKRVFHTLEDRGLILVSEREPIIVTATGRRTP